jgi:O-antigen biosynthesis protein
MENLRARGTVALLYILQPLARLWGRMQGGLTAWRPISRAQFVFPRQHISAVWTEDWRDPAQRLEDVAMALQRQGDVIARGGEFDRWDLEVIGGALAGARLLMAIEDHGAGTQYVRTRCWPRVRPVGVGLLVCLGGSVAVSAAAAPWFVPGFFGLLAGVVLAQALRQSGRAMGALHAGTRPRTASLRSQEHPQLESAAMNEPVAAE